MAYVTLSEVKQAGGYDVSDTFHDGLISSLIPRASNTIEQLTNNVFEVAEVSTRRFDYLLQTDGFKLFFDEYLATTDDLTITNGTGDVIDGSLFVTLPRNHAPFYGVQLKTETSVVWDYVDSPENAIAVSGYWGYSVTPPDAIKQVAIQMILHWVKQNDQETPKPIPDDILMNLQPFKRASGLVI
jgi:hypothetical protein